jgi:hypothetical protein
MKKPSNPATDPARRQAVIYASVSSKEQEKEGFSIPAQLKLLKEYAAARGFAVAQEYIDVETAKQTGRAAFGEMVAQPGGGDASKIEEQPHAKQIAGQIAHAPEPALPCPDAGRDAVPVARDGERALPDAWRQRAGRGQGQ